MWVGINISATVFWAWDCKFRDLPCCTDVQVLTLAHSEAEGPSLPTPSAPPTTCKILISVRVGVGWRGRTISRMKKLNSSGRHGDLSLYLQSLITDISVMRGCHGPYPQRDVYFTFCKRIVLTINAYCGYFVSDTV